MRYNYYNQRKAWNQLFKRYKKMLKDSQKPKQRKDFSERIKRAAYCARNSCCYNCGMITTRPEFDHIDGDRSNNSISNCQVLCPNCHAEKTRPPKYPVYYWNVDFPNLRWN